MTFIHPQTIKYQYIFFFLIADFFRVNRLALSNPRVSTMVSLDCRVSSVIQRLESKFKPIAEKTWLDCIALIPQNGEPQNFSSGRMKSDSELWIVPRPGAVLSRPSIATQVPTTSSSLSLSHLQSKLEPNSNDEGKEEVSFLSQFVGFFKFEKVLLLNVIQKLWMYEMSVQKGVTLSSDKMLIVIFIERIKYYIHKNS